MHHTFAFTTLMQACDTNSAWQSLQHNGHSVRDRHSSLPSPSPGGLCFGAPEPDQLLGLHNAASRLASSQIQPSVMTCLPAVYQLNCLNSLDEYACSTNTTGVSWDHVQKHKVNECAACVQVLCMGLLTRKHQSSVA